MARAKIKSSMPAPPPREQPYAASKDTRRPPYFGECEPTVLRAAIHFEGDSDLRAGANLARTILLDGPPPPTGVEWLKPRAKQIMARPDRPDQVTQAAKQFESEMHEAFIRRQCDEQWGWDSIKHKLLNLGLWPRRRPPKQKERKLPERHYKPEWKRDGS